MYNLDIEHHGDYISKIAFIILIDYIILLYNSLYIMQGVSEIAGL